MCLPVEVSSLRGRSSLDGGVSRTVQANPSLLLFHVFLREVKQKSEKALIEKTLHH